MESRIEYEAKIKAFITEIRIYLQGTKEPLGSDQKVRILSAQHCRTILDMLREADLKYMDMVRDKKPIDEQFVKCVLTMFIRFLRSRWQSIAKLDASYFHTPKSRANMVCAYLAEQISVFVGKKERLHPKNFLLPDLYEKNKHKPGLWDLPFKQLFLADDGVNVYSVFECFEFMERRQAKKMQAEEAGVPFKLDEPEMLTEDEKSRLANHTKSAAAYYRAIHFTTDESKEKREQELAVLRTEFRRSVLADDCELTASYSSSSSAMLDVILNSLSTPEEFIIAVSTVPKDDWPIFIDQLDKQQIYTKMLSLEVSRVHHNAKSGATNLCRLSLEQNLKDYLNRDRTFERIDDRFVRCFLYCYLRTYDHIREDEPEVGNKSYMASYAPAFFSSSLGCYPKTAKQLASKQLADFILGRVFKPDIKGAGGKPVIYGLHEIRESTIWLTHSGPLGSGLLKLFVDLMEMFGAEIQAQNGNAPVPPLHPPAHPPMMQA